MALDQTTADALAREARLQAVRLRESRSGGKIEAIGACITDLSGMMTDEKRILLAAQQEREALESGAGAGLSGDFGPYSVLEQEARTERNAGKGAVIDAAKANPELTLDEACATYKAAALAARSSDRQYVLFDPAALFQLYAINAKAAGYTPDVSWESFRAFVVATDKAALLTM